LSAFFCRADGTKKIRKEERRYKIKDTLLLLYINIFIDIYTTKRTRPTPAKGCGVEAGVATLYKLKDTLDRVIF
jgi:hypothetical protein